MRLRAERVHAVAPAEHGQTGCHIVAHARPAWRMYRSIAVREWVTFVVWGFRASYVQLGLCYKVACMGLASPVLRCRDVRRASINGLKLNNSPRSVL